MTFYPRHLYRNKEHIMKMIHKSIARIADRHPDGTFSNAVVTLDPAGKTIRLRKGQYLRIEDVAGWSIRAFAGTAWLTQDGDTRDVVLEAGQIFTPDRPGAVLLSPLGEARLCISRADGYHAARRAPDVARAVFA
jgi:hypothetical protein